MGVKEYELPNGRKAVFEFDENGIGKITVEAMDRIVELLECKLINERKCDDCIYVKGSQWCEKCNGEPKHWAKEE